MVSLAIFGMAVGIKNAPEVKSYFGRSSFYKRVNVLTLQESAERKNLQ